MDGDAPQTPEMQVIAGIGSETAFSNVQGGRSEFGSLVLQALTGQSEEQILTGLRKQIGQEQFERFQKEIAESGEVVSTLLDAEDQFFLDYINIQGGTSLIAPPIAPERLSRLVTENNSLEPCISAMVTNIACTGFEIVPKEGAEAELTEDEKTAKKEIEDFFAEVYPRKTFLRVRKELRRDLHETGNSYMVVERSVDGKLGFIRRAPSKSMRIVRLDDPVMTDITMRRGDKVVNVRAMRAERRFAQKIGTRLVYYKEYGSKRDLNKNTGEWAPQGSLPPELRANEVIHDKDIEDVRSPYGLPRWITQLPSVLGSRMAEEHNLAFFQSGGVPPVLIFVSGGSVTEPVKQALNAFMAGKSSDKQRGAAFEIPAAAGDIHKDSAVNIQVERFGADSADSTFENYDERNELRIRRAFRIAGIFLGMADSYNFATAHASYVVTEAQVFKPERDEDDEKYNMTIMREIDESGQWWFQSRPLSVQDVNLTLRSLEMLKDVPGVGIKDWVDAVSDAGGADVTVVEEHEDQVFSKPEPPAPFGGGGSGTQDADEEADGQSAGAPPGENEDRPEPGVTSTKRDAQVLAAKMSRAIQDFEAGDDADCLRRLLTCKAAYDALDEQGRAHVETMLTPLLYSTAFVHNAALADTAVAYAEAVFRQAQTLLETQP